MSLTTTSGINQLINVNQPTTTPASSTLGPNAFLTLLTTELKNQDPTQPQDPTQSVTQLAQFSQLQYQQQLSSSFQSFQSNFGVMQAASLVGKTATVSTGTNSTTGNSSTATGTISSVTVQNGTPYFTMTNSSGTALTDTNGNPLLFSISDIVGIGS